MEMLMRGDETISERLEMVIAQRTEVEAQIETLHKTLETYVVEVER